ncbi:hypothetical protein BSK55_09760 [Paenibacillus odorifer]|nr:hypothetical protein BSK55_09760 [Paenibacillus odorifer]
MVHFQENSSVNGLRCNYLANPPTFIGNKQTIRAIQSVDDVNETFKQQVISLKLSAQSKYE